MLEEYHHSFWICRVQAPKGWMDENLIWTRYTQLLPLLLVLDSFRGHITNLLYDRYNKLNTTVSVIPGGCMSVLQPLDVSLVLRQEWTNYMLQESLWEALCSEIQSEECDKDTLQTFSESEDDASDYFDINEVDQQVIASVKSLTVVFLDLKVINFKHLCMYKHVHQYTNDFTCRYIIVALGFLFLALYLSPVVRLISLLLL